MSKLFLFLKDIDFKYYNINCITTIQKEKQNWKQFQKRKRLLSAGSGSARSGSADNFSASVSLLLTHQVALGIALY
jgi:hypothetical protein